MKKSERKDYNLWISTHTPHARRDRYHTLLFLPFFISTHTPHARRDSSAIGAVELEEISTHTPHARRDQNCEQCRNLQMNFNSHASCEA